MSRSLQWNVVAYMISAALLASLFLTFNLPSSAWHERSAERNFPQWQGKIQSLANANTSGPVSPASPKFTFQPVTTISKPLPISTPSAALAKPAAPSASQAVRKTPSVSIASASQPASAVQSASTAPSARLAPEQASAPPVSNTPLTYKVTSFYLNVRALPNADADILREVKQDTILKVRQMTDNGWLALVGGGYVHGRYAVPLSEQTDAQAAQTDASVPDPAKKREVAILSSSSAPIQHRLLTNDAEAAAAAEAVAETAIEADDGGNPVKPTSKIMSDSGMTRAHIAALLKGTKLQGLGLEDVILGVEEKYGINAFFIIAVMKLESGNGKSTLSRTKNNLFGLNAITGDAHRKAFTFKTKGDSIRKFGQLINDNYIGRGYTTIEKVARKYCPANGLWAGHVRTIMRGDFKKLV